MLYCYIAVLLEKQFNNLTMKQFKALITDVDGTLIENGREAIPSKAMIEAVRRASELIHVGVATSRPLYMLNNIFGPLNLSGPSIINGGAQVIDAKTKKILWRRNIAEEDFFKAVEIIQKFNLPFFIQEGQPEDVYYSPGYQPDEKVLQIALVGLEEKTARSLRRKLKVISGLGIHLVPDWVKNRVGIIITHAEATKQYGIFQVAKILGIDTKEIIGVGDGYNDFPLLLACGLKVAMGDAPEDLKAIADIVVPPATKDGLVEVINQYIL